MRNIVFILLISPFLCLSQEKKPDSASINRIVEKVDKLSETNSKSYAKDKVINHKKFIEKWKYFDSKQLSRITIEYTIDSPKYSVAYSEKYYFKDGSLIYAYESEIFFNPPEGIDKGTKWAGYFYFSKEKLIDYVTLGHGKSELDDWDPEKDILMQLKKRKAQLALLK